MANKTPVDPVPVANITDLPGPFPSTIIFYEEKNTTLWVDPPRTIWFNVEAKPIQDLKEPKDWSTFDPAKGVAATVTGTDKKPTTGSFGLTTAPAPGSDTIQFAKVPPDADVPPRSVTFRNKPDSSTQPSAVQTTSASSSSASLGSITSGSSSNIPVETKSTPPSSSAGTSSPAAASSSSVNKSTGLSGGAVAGVAIGCLLAGALLAGILAWLCLRRRKSANSARGSEASAVALMPREKGPVAKTVSVASGSPIASALENGLPQPLEDQAISGEVSKISNLIKNHVQSYYHGRPVSPGLIDYDDIQALGDNLPVSVGTLSTLLNSSVTREVALRFCLAWIVTSRIQLNDTTNTTFLPPEIAKSIQSMNIDHAEQSPRANALFFAKWRALTAELLRPTYVRTPFSAADGRIRNIQAAATLLDNLLRPFADSRMEDGARSRNLEEILKRSAQFAFTLFSQPTSWKFDWQNGQNINSGSLCVFPALVQVTDENGEPLHPPRPFSEAVIRRLDD